MVASLYVLVAFAPHRTFYVSPNGSDDNDGHSKSHPWRSLDRISKEPFLPGDRVLLAGGATFTGRLMLEHGGTPENPVEILSTGSPATIDSQDATAITIRTGGIEIHHLRLTGGASKPAKNRFGIQLDAPKGKRSPHVTVDGVDVVGFGDSGISMGAPKDSPDGFDDVRIVNTHVTGNYGTGIITSDGIADLHKGFAHRRLTISDCDVSRNHDGNGIILSGVDGAVVEFSRATGNESPKGALGMWAWCAKNVTFRYCIANGTRGSSDAGGYDLDGGTVDCVVEHCLSYDNDGPGYMHCDYPDAPRTEHNVMRDSVSIDDGRRAKGEPYGFGFVVWGSGLYDCTIERNVAILTKPDPLARNMGMLFATFIRTESIPLSTQRLEGAVFKDNLVAIQAPGAAFVYNDFPTRKPGDLTFKDDTYLSTAASPFIEGPKAEHVYPSLNNWRTTTGNEQDTPPPKTLPNFKGYENLNPRELPAYFKRIGV